MFMGEQMNNHMYDGDTHNNENPFQPNNLYRTLTQALTDVEKWKGLLTCYNTNTKFEESQEIAD